MKKLSLDLDISKLKNCKQFFQTENPKEVFVIMINAALDARYKDGQGKTLQRRAFNICNKIEGSKENFVELEDAEFQLLDESFDDKAKFKSIFRDVLMQIYDLIDEAKIDNAKPSKENK